MRCPLVPLLLALALLGPGFGPPAVAQEAPRDSLFEKLEAHEKHLIKSLKTEVREFEHEICEDFAGGHSMNRVDSPLARRSREEVYAFLARYLKP